MLEIIPILLETQLTTLRSVSIAAYRDHYLHLWHDDGAWYLQKYFSAEALKNEWTNPNAAFFLAYWKENPVGFLKLNLNAALKADNAADELELERIYLMHSATGLGIGKQLLNETIAIARGRHKKKIWLKAMDSSLAAIKFYAKHGFETCGTHHLDFQQMKEEYRGMVIMERKL
jgi:diamine N-acetyltransferase